MAKKIVSLLCAVAMLVTMATIIAFPASAAGTVSVNLLSSANTSKWTRTKNGFTSTGGLFAGAVDMTQCSGWSTSYNAADDIQGMIMLLKSNAGANRDGSAYVEFTYQDSLPLGDDFTLKYTTFSRGNIGTSGKTPTVDSHMTVKLGKYTISMAHVASDVASFKNYNFWQYRLIVYKNGTEIGRSAILSTNTTDAATFGGSQIYNRYTTLWGSTSGNAGNTYVRQNCFASSGTNVTMSSNALIAGSGNDSKGARDVSVVVKDGKLSILNTDGKAISFTTATSTVTSFDVLSGEFDAIQPVIHLEAESQIMTNYPLSIVRMSATYAESGSEAKVTFDGNGGEADVDSVKVNDQGKLASLPSASKKGGQFLGWFTEETDGEEITTDTVFSTDTTVYAHWEDVPYVEFDANGGTCATEWLNTVDGKVASMPTPTLANATFLGWFTAADGGDEVTSDTTITTSDTLYAHWRAHHLITFDAAGGTCSVASAYANTNNVLTSLPSNLVKKGGKFLGWYSAAEGGEEITLSTQFNASTTIFAHWQDVPYVEYDANGGKCGTDWVNTVDGQLTSLPSATYDIKHEFLGWSVDKTDGEIVALDHVYTSNTTLYAQWKVLPGKQFDSFYGEKNGSNIENANYTTDVKESWGKNMVHSDTYGDFLIVLGSAATSIKATQNKTYNLGDKFTFSFDAMFQTSNKGDYDSYVQVGDLKIALKKSSTLSTQIVPTVTYGGDSVVDFNGEEVVGLSINGENGSVDQRAAISAATATGVGGSLSTGNMPTRRLMVTVSYDNGTITVSFTGDSGVKTYSGTIDDADFSNASVVMCCGKATAVYQSCTIGNFSGLYYEGVLAPAGAWPTQGESQAMNFVFTDESVEGFDESNLTATIQIDGEDYASDVAFETVKGYRVIRVTGLNPAYFASDITVTLTDGETTGAPFTYSMEDYCNAMFTNGTDMLGDTDDTNDQQAAYLCELMAGLFQYGRAAMAYKSMANIPDLPGAMESFSLTEIAKIVVDAPSASAGGVASPISLSKSGLYLEDELLVYLEFDAADVENATISAQWTVPGDKLDLVTDTDTSSTRVASGKKRFVVYVPAKYYMDSFTVQVFNDTADPISKEYTLSLAAFANLNVKPTDSTDLVSNLCAYMLNYCDKCCQYASL